ncbi:UNVERIFIED_ORG: hypothetical protein ABIC54_004998 [Burkholderia sp. 1263]
MCWPLPGAVCGWTVLAQMRGTAPGSARNTRLSMKAPGPFSPLPRAGWSWPSAAPSLFHASIANRMSAMPVVIVSTAVSTSASTSAATSVPSSRTKKVAGPRSRCPFANDRYLYIGSSPRFIDIRFSMAPPHPRKTHWLPRPRLRSLYLPPVCSNRCFPVRHIGRQCFRCESLSATPMPCGSKALSHGDPHRGADGRAAPSGRR